MFLVKDEYRGERLSREGVIFEDYLRGYPKNNELSKEQEQEIAHLPENHELRWSLVLNNIRFCLMYAKSVYNSNKILNDWAETFSTAREGMEIASRKFKPRNAKFICCAIWYMRREMNKAIHKQLCPVKLPPYRDRNKRLLREDLSYTTGVEKIDATAFSINDGPRRFFSEEDSYGFVEKNQLKEHVEKVVRILGKESSYLGYPGSSVDSQMLSMSLGMGTGMELDNSSIGAIFGVGKERVRQRLQRAREALRKSHLLKEWVQ